VNAPYKPRAEHSLVSLYQSATDRGAHASVVFECKSTGWEQKRG